MRPEFIERGMFRAYLKPGQLNKHFQVDGILPSSFIARCERGGRPISSKGGKHWRILDVVARAFAEGLTVEPPYQSAVTMEMRRFLDAKAVIEKELAELKQQCNAARHVLALSEASKRLTEKTLLTEAEIAEGKMHIAEATGVYFLLRGTRVVYVGQSVNVFSRIMQHADKKFDAFAYIPCDARVLDTLESLYIHTLRPELNGKQGDTPCAPMRLDALLASPMKLKGLRK